MPYFYLQMNVQRFAMESIHLNYHYYYYHYYYSIIIIIIIIIQPPPVYSPTGCAVIGGFAQRSS